MLVLSRRKDEWVDVGDNIEITIVEVRGDVVKLGFRAPRDVAIHRREVSEAIRREGPRNVDAMQGSDSFSPSVK